MSPKQFIFQTICIILFLQSSSGSTVSVSSKPNITFLRVGEAWKKFNSKELWLHSANGDDLIFKCSAKYPIQWKIDGLIAPPEVVKVQPPTRDLYRNAYEIQTNIFFADAEEYSGIAASSSITCMKIGDSQVHDEFSIFIRGSGSNSLRGPTNSFVTDSFLIPCFTTDPLEPTLLFRRTTEGSETRVTNAMFEPTRGFRAKVMFDGEYICRQRSSQVFITANRTRSIRGYEFSPLPDNVRKFSENVFDFKCASIVKPVNLLYKDSKFLNFSWVQNTERLKHLKISVSAHAKEHLMNTSLKGSAACVTKDDELVKDWSFEFIETPQLYLDNFEGEVDCLSNHKEPKMVQTVRCKNSIDCDFMKHCLKNTSLCNFKKQKQFFANSDTFCWIEKLESSFDCVSVPYSHLNGLAQCNVGGLMKTWEFFVSLGFLKYDNWQDAPLRELLIMDEVPEILYTNKTTQFFCTGVAYLFTDSLAFEIELTNGSRSILIDNGLDINISNPSSSNPRKIDEFNVLGVLDIKLPIDAIAIHCIAPWWNSTDSLITTRKFETRHLLPPTFVAYSPNHIRDGHVVEQFYIGEKNRRLTCHALGEPQPKYIWLIDRQNATDKFKSLQVSSGSNGEGYLEFSEVEEKHAGTYTCVAKNEVSSETKTFLLEVTDEPISGTSVGFITIMIIVLIILTLLLAAFVVLSRRYKATKELVRSLTDSEIDEFFHGRPELLSKADPNAAMESIDFLPFQNNYEITMADIEFDSSEKNWLGSGEFSYVVRGRIISRNKWVAVKISKPSADVVLFKSLLSEIKVMIFIGEHNNIATLVGVCTEGIRNRCIHIATEICEFGSLDKFLLKSRPNFVSLMNENQSIDMSLLPQDGIHVSTFDLISFSAQIAKGMEFLAGKSIVHADLAARNVLLTEKKVAKISDFGLSKKLYECNNYVKRTKSPLPWRWMSLEALTTLTFSTQSDVWSYGATMYELFTLGDIPFPNEEWNKEFLTRLANGMRMGRPKYSTQEIYSKIVTCWESEPAHRPSFSTLRLFFEELLQEFPEDAFTRFNLPIPNEEVTVPLYVNCNDGGNLTISQVDAEPNSSMPTPKYINLE